MSSTLEVQIQQLLRPLDPLEIILFGSRASNRFWKDSDVDLLIVLREQGICRTYAEKRAKRRKVRDALRPLSGEYAFDLLVYTADEWRQLKRSKAPFLQEVLSSGKEL